MARIAPIALAAALLAGLGAATAAEARDPYRDAPPPRAALPGLDRHQAYQEGWQRYGAAQGYVTRDEARRIDSAQAALRRQETAALADGRVTPREAWQLRAEASRVDGVIARQYYDREVRPGWGWGGRGW